MNRRSTRALGAWQRVVAVAGAVGIAAGVLALGTPTASAATQQAAASQSAGSAAQASAAQTTRDYVIRFWGRWVTWGQQSSLIASQGSNALFGPAEITPRFRTVNLINDDTIYAFGYVDTRVGPVVLTIPDTTVSYSVLVLDMFQEVVQTDLPQAPGTYLLVTEGWQGTVPAGMTKVTIPKNVPLTLWNIRSDKYSSTNQDMIAEATAFRAAVHMTTLANYQADPTSGAVKILPTFPYFVFSWKVAEDLAATVTPSLFLRTMQRAVANSGTTPLSASDIRLSRAFDRDFAAAQQAARRGNPVPLARIHAATRAAYAAIAARWRTHVGATNWTHFDNIADWGTAYLDRAAANEYCQGCNNAAAAGYWMAFFDGRGQRLNGARHSYKLHFTADQLPDAQRFWSLTAYTPATIALIRNPANKYLVARYTPGLVYNADGSLDIYMSVTKPANVPAANWLPTRRGQFEVALRVYGPTGNTAVGAGYIPPRITTVR
jgi:hypothetical protein